MSLNKLISISSMPGLFRMSANRSNGLIVENLDNGKRRFVSARRHQFTPLESISIYTMTDTVELRLVFAKMLRLAEEFPVVSAKAPEIKLREYFDNILPDYDEDKVYISDIRKLIKWYEFLNERNLLDIESLEKDPAESEEE